MQNGTRRFHRQFQFREAAAAPNCNEKRYCHFHLTYLNSNRYHIFRLLYFLQSANVRSNYLVRNEPVITSFEIILKCTCSLEMKCLYFDTLSICHNFFKMLGLIYKNALLKEWQHVMANNVYAPNSKNTTIAIKQKKQTWKLLAYPEIETETSGNAVRWVNCRQLKVS